MITKGQKINDRYKIIKTIGEGGMANVYLAVDEILNREVAVKVLRGDLAEDDKFVRRFQREAISASSLNHPNIVEVYDVGEDDGSYFIVMEYINGITLKSLVKKRNKLSLIEVVDIMKQLTSGIACAHKNDIIHRDIKPQNVMILDDGTVKITDFGIATALNNVEMTQTNSIMGSVHYLPPEQASGKATTFQSDIYSLGILMYELLTGTIPFKGDTAVEVAMKQMKEDLPSVVKKNPEIPQSVENILMKSCAKNPLNRYETVEDMHDDILVCLDEKHAHDKPYVYKYPEHDFDKAKKEKALKELKKVEFENLGGTLTMTKNKKEGKILNLLVAVTGFLFVFLALGLAAVVIIYPKVTEVGEVTITDVSNMDVSKARRTLEALDLKVNTELTYKSSSTVEQGKVISTNPVSGRTVKKGKNVSLIVSSGVKGIVLENYVGKNYYEIKEKLELAGIKINVETEDISAADNKKVDENMIIGQNPKPGTIVSEGDSIIITLPNIVTEYPDFVKEKWTYEKVVEFCSKYGVTVVKATRETADIPEGTVVAQSRDAGMRVTSPYTLTITVAVPPTIDTGEFEE